MVKLDKIYINRGLHMKKINQELDDFVHFKRKAKTDENYFLTILDDNGLHTINLLGLNKTKLTFGTNLENDIIITSNAVDFQQGYLELTEYGILAVNTSSEVLMLGNNNKSYKDLYLSDGCFVKMINPNSSPLQGAIMIMSIAKNLDEWKQYSLQPGGNSLGSGSSCDVVLPPSGVAKTHASIYYSKNGISLYDEFSINGTYLNGQKIPASQKIMLNNLDVVFIGNSKIILYGNKLIYQIYNRGVQLDAIDIVKRVRIKFKTKEISSHINMSIYPSEFVAFVGGSGAGKSTFMKCISGVDKPSSGTVLINGENLYDNYETLKYNIGYVPQEDIVYSNLTLHDMLHYAAKLRMPDNTTRRERTDRIKEVLDIVQLSEFENSYIRQLSGGQRKRASIAVELIADPNLFFLDEPTSGLDPGTERSIMQTLQNMAKMGKTIILVTHNTLNLHLCDKVAFFGEGGHLCFYGTPQEALNFYGVDDFVDIYTLLNENVDGWYEKFQSLSSDIAVKEIPAKKNSNVIYKKKSFFKQLINLIKRYIKLISNDLQQMFLLFAQAPIVAVLLSIVANSNLYSTYDDTKAIMFSIGCACIWLGLLNSVQEICKEKVILQKEHMADLKLSAYLLSKFIVQGLLAFLQSTLLILIFQGFVGKSEYSILIDNYWDIQIICFLSIWSSAALGLFISSLVKNSNIAMSIIPLILVPQLLFSGMLFKLKTDISKFISNFVLCRWSVEGLGTSVNLNELTHIIQTFNPLAEVEPEDYFTFTSEHMINVIVVISVMTATLILASYFVLRKNVNKNM